MLNFFSFHHGKDSQLLGDHTHSSYTQNLHDLEQYTYTLCTLVLRRRFETNRTRN